MTVSNVHTFTLNASQIIRESLELTATIDMGSAVPPEIMASCMVSANLYLKSWQAKGLFLHTFKPATLFLDTDQQSYLLGPTGDHCTESYVSTTLTADAAISATALIVDSETGMTVADKVGVVMDDGAMHWTTIASLAPLTLTTGITGAATSGNAVYAYTTKIIRPIKIADVRYLDNDIEIPVTKISNSEYNLLTNKDSASRPTQYAYDPQLDNSRLYVWPVADSASRLVFACQKPVDDLTTDSDTVTAPVDWFQCLTLGLSYTIAPKLAVGLDRQAALKKRYDDALSDLDDFEETSIFFQPARRR